MFSKYAWSLHMHAICTYMCMSAYANSSQNRVLILHMCVCMSTCLYVCVCYTYRYMYIFLCNVFLFLLKFLIICFTCKIKLTDAVFQYKNYNDSSINLSFIPTSLDLIRIVKLFWNKWRLSNIKPTLSKPFEKQITLA